jgi:hypothetical protein
VQPEQPQQHQQQAQPEPDADSQGAMAPGDCPESGGYLAEALNSLFDTDIETACGPGKMGSHGKGRKGGAPDRHHDRRH